MSAVGTVWERVLEHVDAAPEHTALESAAGKLSYTEFSEQARELAKVLDERSTAGSLVAFQIPDLARACVAVVAAASARRAFMPLASDSPQAHRAKVLRDAGPELVISIEKDGTFRCEAVEETQVDSYSSGMADIAYVMYTSGSTGQPKGVVVSHQALLERLAGLAAIPGLRPGESMLAMTALSFDISMAELLLPLYVGGTVVAAPEEARLDPSVFMDCVALHRPDVLQATPSFWRLALAVGWQGSPTSRIWCGGEAMTSTLAQVLLNRCAALWNVYGPTEATIWATADLVHDAGRISLGQPLPGSGLFIVDSDGSVVSKAGRPGELTLHGAGLADGYLNRGELTSERFISLITPQGERTCYRTGDRVQYRDDATIEFLGRMDDQVKLRGHRVELGEIESVLESHPEVSQSVVLLRDTDAPERASLVAFVVIPLGGITTSDLRRWLASRLPPIMRPARFLQVDELPRTIAGKIDRVRLKREMSGI
ncbi:amino acid adenylation domain-containing protein [Actinoplanes sp. Pm04-4]|uniref:Amino acid adenylation domain-containing protein n=1 Tax=Paractinoplanes pyxinae TaxID=2997416 RepID=A0ABT4BC31_9ACTN|nr:amino acid adenylation domain-containing protein [Actinoplanes pyxinae]MCY1144084.1 amino acid adenylation domain-containing protein [Actinoplanes pyxinae]